MASTTSKISHSYIHHKYLKYFVPVDIDPDLPGQILQVGKIKFHRQMIFGSMDDEQVELATSLLSDAKLDPNTLSCFLINTLGILSSTFYECPYPTAILVAAHHLTLQIALLFEGTKLFYYWLFQAEGIVHCTSGTTFHGDPINWPNEVMSIKNHPKIDAAYLQMIKAVCSHMRDRELVVHCPWSHLLLLHGSLELSLTINAPYYRFYCRQILDPKTLCPLDVANSLLIPKPNFCIAREIKKGETQEYSFMVHDWIMYAAWPYFCRLLISQMCTERKLILPKRHFSERTLYELVAMCYNYNCGTASQLSFWQATTNDVLDEFGLHDFATRYGRVAKPVVPTPRKTDYRK